MMTLRTATDISIIWDDSPDCDGWYVRYTDEDGSICDETMGMGDDPDADIRDLYRDAVAALAYAGCCIACDEIDIVDNGAVSTVQVANLIAATVAAS